MSDSFYSYALVNPVSGAPFYIGKGKGRRAFEHVTEAFRTPSKGSNRHKINTIKQIVSSGNDVKVVMIAEGVSEADAFECEEFAISFFGRADLGLGPLTNLTDGGEGLVGIDRDMRGKKNPNFGKRGEESIWWGRKHTEETKRRISLSLLGRVLTEEHRAKMRKPKSPEGRAAIAKARAESTYSPSEETRRKQSVALTGRPSPMRGKRHTDEARAKISAAGKGRPSHRKGKTIQLSDEAKESLRAALKWRNEAVVVCSHCGKEGKFVGMIRWHMDNCKEKANGGA